MTTKSYGPAVSGYLDPDGRAFEIVVHQAGKPVLDKELNLGADLNVGAAQTLLRYITPSGWVSGDFTAASTLYQATADLNTLAMPALLAHVNGWVIPIIHTGVNGANKVSLGAGPAGVGAKRTDLVVLEVWRKLLDTTADGKSPTGRIWANGNVKVPSASDAILNYVDDMLDGVVGAETTKRVQIQYRLRVIQGVDVFAYPAGIDDPTVVANTVPASAGSPDGTATAFPYANQSPNDAGLWRAGDGVPTNGLGTVDGYMYAIPLAAVFRRNTAAFAKNTNQNGGVAFGGASDRPDGLFHDVIDERDLADLRRGISLGGASEYQEILEKNFGGLLDNALKTEWGQFGVGGGQEGHTMLAADEIGVSNANGGDGSTNGDTPGANFIGEFDYTRRRFSDRVIYEVMTVQVSPGTAAVSTAAWQAGTVVTLDPTQLAPYPHSAFNFPAFAPANTRIVDVLRARVIGQAAGKSYCEVGVPTDPDTAAYPITTVTGLGEFPIASVVITLGAPPVAAGLSNEPMFIDLLVAYPPGNGLTYTATQDYGANSFSLNNPSALPNTAPISFSNEVGLAFDPAHREVNLEYRTVPLTFTFYADSTGDRTTFVLPERVDTVVQVLKNGAPVTGNVDSMTKRILTLAADATAGDEIQVDYRARRPMPQSGAQYTVYYEARAPQTIRAALLGTSVTLIPRYVSPYLYSISTGSGSVGEGYPYPFAYVQSGGVYPSALGAFSGDHQLDGSAQLTVANFGAETGFLKLAAVVPYVPDANGVTLQRLVGDVDSEGRSYFKTVPAGYVPNAYAQPLSDSRIHKVLLPVLMEAAADSTVATKGTLLLVVFTRWATADNENSIRFSSDLNVNTTSASIFRLNGNMLNKKV